MSHSHWVTIQLGFDSPSFHWCCLYHISAKVTSELSYPIFSFLLTQCLKLLNFFYLLKNLLIKDQWTSFSHFTILFCYFSIFLPQFFLYSLISKVKNSKTQSLDLFQFFLFNSLSNIIQFMTFIYLLLITAKYRIASLDQCPNLQVCIFSFFLWYLHLEI